MSGEMRELRPYIREYGGGDDRWCWHRQQFTKELWDLLCDGHGGEFAFAEYGTEERAWLALANACLRLVGPCSTTITKARTYRPKATQPIYISPFTNRMDTRTIEEVLRVPRDQRTKRDVLRIRDEAGVMGGCCDRFADMSPCHCLEEARDG